MMTKTYDGQTARFLASVATCMPPLSGDVMQGWIDNPQALKNFLSGLNPQVAVGEKKEAYKSLSPCRQTTVGPPTKPFNPQEFFVEGDDLWVSNEFTDRILSVAQTTEPPGTASLQSFSLVRRAYDSEIRPELPENHTVELWQIAELIKCQPKGKEGDLLNNGYANIFYVVGKGGEVFAVRVDWVGGDRQWFVRAWPLDEDVRWSGDCRVFSRN